MLATVLAWATGSATVVFAVLWGLERATRKALRQELQATEEALEISERLRRKEISERESVINVYRKERADLLLELSRVDVPGAVVDRVRRMFAPAPGDPLDAHLLKLSAARDPDSEN